MIFPTGGKFEIEISKEVCHVSFYKLSFAAI